MTDHVLLKVKVAGDIDEETLRKIIEGIYKVHLDVFSVESEAVEQGVQPTASPDSDDPKQGTWDYFDAVTSKGG